MVEVTVVPGQEITANASLCLANSQCNMTDLNDRRVFLISDQGIGDALDYVVIRHTTHCTQQDQSDQVAGANSDSDRYSHYYSPYSVIKSIRLQ